MNKFTCEVCGQEFPFSGGEQPRVCNDEQCRLIQDRFLKITCVADLSKEEKEKAYEDFSI
jgi:hypothetical protein